MPSAEVRLAELEKLCADAELAMGKLDWDTLAAALVEQRRVTHALGIALAAQGSSLEPEVRREIDRRLRAVAAYRENQLERLKSYNAGLAGRLSSVAKFKDAARSLGVTRPRSKLGNLDQLR